METRFDTPLATLRRAFLRMGALLGLLIPGAMVVSLYASGRGSFLLPLALPVGIALSVGLAGIALRLRLENKRLVLRPPLLVQSRGSKTLWEARLEEIREVIAYTRKGSSNPFGLQWVVITLRSGGRIVQYCEDAADLARAVAQAAARPDFAVRMDPGLSRTQKTALWICTAALALLLPWIYLSGHLEFHYLFLGTWFVCMGIWGVFFKGGSSRYGYRKLELVFGILAFAAGSLSLYEFVRFESLSDLDKGIWYVTHCQRKGASRVLEEVRADGGEGPKLSYGLGLLAFLEKDFDQAESRLQEALRLDPALNDARYQLSRTYGCMGRDEEAKKLLEEYLARGGGSWTSQAKHALKEYFGEGSSRAGGGGGRELPARAFLFRPGRRDSLRDHRIESLHVRLLPAFPVPVPINGKAGETLKEENRRHGLELTSKTADCFRDGERMDLHMAVDGLLACDDGPVVEG